MPDDATPAPPKSWYEKAGAALPVALTALATAFAGMSTSELQQAMVWRSHAAQDQARATNQWTFAGLKRDRALICQTTAAQLWATANNPPNPFAGKTNSEAAAWLGGNGPAAAKLPDVTDANLVKLLADIQARAPEAELVQQAARVPFATINAVLNDAEQFVKKTDDDWDGTLKAAARLAADAPRETATAARAAHYELENRRYLIESAQNQGVGYLYEARVKVSSAQSEKHQRKSKNFFYAMLAAQVGATLAALALARQKRSVLWAVAGGTGLVALVIGGYVYLSDA